VSCVLCGGGDQWDKTVRDGEGDTFPICDWCWQADRSGLVIVPGPVVVAARCDRCGGYFNPREIAPTTLRPAARKDAFGGVCRGCAG
jgi:hypothetical protein